MATWTLCLITTMAFIAAYEAAKKAGEALDISVQTYQLETAKILGISLCEKPEHKIARAEFYYVSGVLEAAPQPGREDQYVPVAFDFENLGRVALLDLVVDVALDGGPAIAVRIGNIGAERHAHVAIHFDWAELKRPPIAWRSPAKVGSEDLDYKPLPRLTIGRNLPQTSVGTEVPPAERKWRLSFAESDDSTKAVEEEPKDV